MSKPNDVVIVNDKESVYGGMVEEVLERDKPGKMFLNDTFFKDKVE